MKNLLDDKHEESACDICDLKLSPMQTVKTHMRIHHMKHSQTQTDDASYDDKGSQSEETHSTLDKIVQTSEGAQSDQAEHVEIFLKYQCFYCELKIESREHLKDHRKKCRDKSVQLNLQKISSKSGFPQLSFPPIGFPSLGFSSLGFPPHGFSSIGFPPHGFSSLGFQPSNQSTLAPMYSSCS